MFQPSDGLKVNNQKLLSLIIQKVTSALQLKLHGMPQILKQG